MARSFFLLFFLLRFATSSYSLRCVHMCDCVALSACMYACMNECLYEYVFLPIQKFEEKANEKTLAFHSNDFILCLFCVPYTSLLRIIDSLFNVIAMCVSERMCHACSDVCVCEKCVCVCARVFFKQTIRPFKHTVFNSKGVRQQSIHFRFINQTCFKRNGRKEL